MSAVLGLIDAFIIVNLLFVGGDGLAGGGLLSCVIMDAGLHFGLVKL